MGSSTMPHKRNPVGCAAALTAAVRVPALVSTMLSGMVQEQERALGGWQAEWDTLPEIASLCAAALAQITHVVSGLNIDEKQMRANIDITRGLVMAESVSLALAPHIGREASHKQLEQACALTLESGQTLLEVLRRDVHITAHLSPVMLEKLLDPEAYTGEAQALIERVLTAHQQRKLTS